MTHQTTITERTNGSGIVRHGWTCTCGATDHIKVVVTAERAAEHAAAHLHGIHGQAR